jgi:hypothetical protein
MFGVRSDNLVAIGGGVMCTFPIPSTKEELEEIRAAVREQVHRITTGDSAGHPAK